jgi:hypothetical protein
MFYNNMFSIREQSGHVACKHILSWAMQSLLGEWLHIRVPLCRHETLRSTDSGLGSELRQPRDPEANSSTAAQLNHEKTYRT